LRTGSLDLDPSDSSEESESESLVDESESLSELEDSESESEAEAERERLAFLRGASFSFPLSSFDRSFSFASNILSAVPIGFLNSSTTSTEGLNFFGFSSC